MSISVSDVDAAELSELPAVDLAPLVSDAAVEEMPAKKVTRPRTGRTTRKSVSGSVRATGAVNAAPATTKPRDKRPRISSNAERPPATPAVGDVVAKAIADLVVGIGALESVAVAKFDALIEKLQATETELITQSDALARLEVVTEGAPRRGRHISDEVTFSIHSFVGGGAGRHRLETVPGLIGIAS